MCLLDVSTFVQSDRERGGRKGPDFGGVLMMPVVEEIADEWAKREKREIFRVWGKIGVVNKSCKNISRVCGMR
jgi:hypothetical protein